MLSKFYVVMIITMMLMVTWNMFSMSYFISLKVGRLPASKKRAVDPGHASKTTTWHGATNGYGLDQLGQSIIAMPHRNDLRHWNTKTPTFGELQFRYGKDYKSPSPVLDRDYQKEARKTVVGELSRCDLHMFILLRL